MSVTATAFIATAFIATDQVEAASHKVQSGDTLWSISKSANTSVDQLRKLNNLSGDTIYLNQVLETSGTPQNNTTTTKPQAPTATQGSTYTVKRGDSLSSIARSHNMSLTSLMQSNNLDTTLIYPGNVLSVNGSSNGSSAGSAESKPTPTPPSAGNSTGSTTYIVKSGDTLSAISRANNVSVANIKSWNSLNSDTIRIGQSLTLNGSAQTGSGNVSSGTVDKPTTPVVNGNFDVNQLINSAKSVQGVSYVWGGTTTSGFDCSGFIHYAFDKAGLGMGRQTVEGYYSRSYAVDTPQVGDLVFFKGTYKAGISHMGIYLGNNQFIHAGTSTGVAVASLDNSYWSKHYDGFKRFY